MDRSFEIECRACDMTTEVRVLEEDDGVSEPIVCPMCGSSKIRVTEGDEY